MSPGGLIAARRPPEYAALVSVGVNLTTAMLLVDYAVHGLTTPTPWAGAVGDRLPAAARRQLDDLRSFLGHGAVVRDFLCRELDLHAKEHGDWPALRSWLYALPRARIAAMVDGGIMSNLEYYRDTQPSPEVADLLARVPRTEAGLPDLSRPGGREAALRAVIAGWGVPRPGAALRLAGDPDALRASLLDVLDAIWHAGFDDAWGVGAAALAEAAAQAEARSPAATALPAEARVAAVTGLEPDADIAALLRGAERIVFAPCLHLGAYLSVLAPGRTRFVLYGPADARPTAQALDLAALGPALEALGDATRLQIMLRLRERGEMHAQQLAEELDIHQSTVSRQLNRLERAEMLWVHRAGGVRHYRVNEERIRHVADMLRRALTRAGSPGGRA